MPLFSIAIPTRNRPEALSHNLWSLKNQTFGDFECIVSDNGTTATAEHVVKELDDARFIYKKTPKDLGATDSWNFANEGTKGEYVISLHDKVPLHLDHLERVAECLSATNAELINWNGDLFFPPEGVEEAFHGTFLEYPKLPVPGPFAEYDGREALKHQAAFSVPRGQMGESYYVGGVHGGCCHEALRKRIIQRTGKLYHAPYSDYTARVPGLLLAKKLVKMTAAGGVCICFSSQSIGWRIQTEQSSADSYLQSVADGSFDLAKLPFPNLTVVLDNVAALCYEKMMAMLPAESAGIKVDLPNLWLRCEESLNGVTWGSEQEKGSAMAALASGLEKIPALQRLSLWLHTSSRPALRRLSTLDRPTRTAFARRFAIPAVRIRNAILGDHCGIREGLLYLGLERLREKESSESNASMNTAPKSDESTTPSLISRVAGDPVLSSLVETLRARPEEMAAEITARKDEIDQLQEKISNFKGMIERRDGKIAKLEGRLAGRKKAKG